MIRKKMFIFLAIMFMITTGIGTVHAVTGSGSGGSSGSGTSGNGCVRFGLCHNAHSFLAMKVTLQYYNATTNKMSIDSRTRPYYVIWKSDNYNKNLAKALGGDDTKKLRWEYRKEWFVFGGGKHGYQDDVVFMDIIGGRNVSMEESTDKLNKWLKKLSINKNAPVTSNILAQEIRNGKEHCAIEEGYSAAVKNSRHSSCYKKSGYRIIIEPVVRAVADKDKRTSTINENIAKYSTEIIHAKEKISGSGSNHDIYYVTNKQLAKIFGKEIGTTSAWTWADSGCGQGMIIDYDDVGVKYEARGLGKNESYQCLKSDSCGYGYYIIDPSAAVAPSNAYVCKIAESDASKCEVLWYQSGKLVTYKSGPDAGKANALKVKYTENGQIKEGKIFPCSSVPGSTVTTSSGNTYNLAEKCPKPKIAYTCRDDSSTFYGRCSIINTVSNQVVYTGDCNSMQYSMYNNVALTDKCPFKPKYNYDIDVACEGCDDKNTEGSYHIQDTSDWEAIIHSTKRSDNGNLVGYYKKENGILCRDEFHVVLPNGNNTSKVYAVRGSRITVNGSGMFSINGVYNFESIKVTRTRECLSTGGNLNSLTNLTDSDMGKINLNYIADSYSNKFTGDLALVVDTSYKAIGGVNTSTINVNSRWPSEVASKGYSVRKDTLTRYFKLTDDVYRWVAGGKAVLKKPADTSNYLDVGESNLPVSFVNNKNVIVQLNYQVPENSNLYKAVKAGKVDYLGTHSEATEKDIYNNGGVSGAKNNPFADSASNKSTACAKMYGYNTGPYKTCINDRFNKSKTCISQFTTKDDPAKGFGGNSSQIYSCTIKNCSTKEDAEKAKVPWNEKGQYCCPAGTVYNPTTGTCDTNLCRIENGKYYDDNNHEITKDEFDRKCTCQILPNGNYILDDGKTKTNDYSKFRKACPICKLQNGKYYGKYGKVVTKEVYEKECPAGKCVVVGEPECPPSTWINNDPCIRCPYTGLCPMPGGVCPTPDGRDIIYRPIDLIDPFPGQSASTRNTGTNWCSYDIKNNKLICNGKPASATSLGKDGNPIVYTDIIDNRGTKGYTVYDKNPLYSVELDANAIKQIQKYNAGNSYDDWSNITYSDAVGSKSSFVHSSKYGFTLSNDSECKNTGNGNLKTCAER